MSQRSSRGDVGAAGDPCPRGGPHPPGPGPVPIRVKRRKTKRERDIAKFGRKVPGGGWRGAGPPPRRLPLPWGGRSPPSPLPAPKTVVITQKRLCRHGGMFNREVKSVDVERLLSPPPVRDPSPPPEGDPRPVERPSPRRPEPPRNEEEPGVPAELAGRLRALLGRLRAFPGRDLAGERRGALLATLLRRHRAPPDLSFLLAHRNRGADVAPPGRWSPRTPEREPRGSAERGDFGERDATPPYGGTPSPLRAIVRATPTFPAAPAAPSPVFGGDPQKREPPFSWSSCGEDEPHPDSPAPLFRPRGGRTPSWGDPRGRGGSPPRGGVPPASPRAYEGPALAPDFGEDAGEGCSWSCHSPPRRRRAPRRSVPAPLARRRPELCRGGSPDPRPPQAWSPDPPLHPCAERRAAPCCCRHRRPPPHGSRRLACPSTPLSPGTCCWQREAPREFQRRHWWDWENWCEAPEPGWLRALRRLPLSCFPPAAGDGSALPSPEPWGCPCAGPY